MSQIKRSTPLLNTQQREFLSVYLHHSMYLTLDSNGVYKMRKPRETPKQIANRLKVATKEALYDVLEDYSNITDPMFDILLTALLA